MEIGKVALSSMLTQIDLITTLSVAVIGGVSALLVQLAFRNVDLAKPSISLTWLPLLLLSIALEGIAIVSGYLATGAVTNAVPILLQTIYEQNLILSEYDIKQLNRIRSVMTVQFVAFISGIGCVFVILLKNLSTINGEQ